MSENENIRLKTLNEYKESCRQSTLLNRNNFVTDQSSIGSKSLKLRKKAGVKSSDLFIQTE